MLVAPEQAFFVRENLKLRLLNARIALLSRQFDTAQVDLKTAQAALEHYFDRSSRRTVLAIDLVKQVSAQAPPCRRAAPSDTLAALAAVAAALNASSPGLRAPRRPATADMRFTIWFVLLFAVAVVAASTLGTNDGLVTFYWRGWRLDLSLNLFLLLLIGTCFVLVTVIQGTHALVGLPRRAREWRMSRRDRIAQARAARRAGAVFRRPLQPLAEVGAAGADDPGRDARAGAGQRIHRARPPARGRQRAPAAGPRRPRCRAAPGARAVAAQRRRASGRGGRAAARRRMGARRPRRRACARTARRAAARRRAPHPCAAPEAAGGAARPAAAGRAEDRAAAGQAPGHLEGRRRRACCARSRSSRSTTRYDGDQLRRVWLQFDPLDRRDPFVAARAAARAVELGALDEARGWLRPFWERLADLGADERAAVAAALLDGDRRHRPRMAAAPRSRVAGIPARRRHRADGRLRRWPSASSGARPASCSSRPRPMPRCRARRDARPGSRWRSWRSAKATRRAPPNASKPPPACPEPRTHCYTARLSGCSSVG